MKFRNSIKKFSATLLALAFVMAAGASIAAEPDQAKGQQLFEQNCTSCHVIEGTKSIGPNLKDVDKRHSEAWLLKWIKNAPAMVKSGDPEAVKLYEANGKQNMNVFENFSDDDIKNILAYVKAYVPPVADIKKEGGPDKITPEPPKQEADSGVRSMINVLIIVSLIAILIIIGAVFDVLGLISRYTKIPFSNPNKINAWLMLVAMILGLGAVFWEFKVHGKYALLGDSASEHGVAVDSMLMTTLWITGVVFVITHIVLFWFAFRYRYSEKRRGYYYPHNNMLEYVWTFIPAVALTVLVINGFVKWSHITKKAPKEAENVELFAFQFGWTARYSGNDGKLGEYSFNLISGKNSLGLGVKSDYDALVQEVSADRDTNVVMLKRMGTIPDPTSKEEEEMEGLRETIRLQNAHLSRLEALKDDKRIFNGAADDDKIVKELVFVKDKPVNLVFRARDVIHSAFSPHFRMQMNCVPGMPTSFWFVPTKTTSEMRQILDDPKFDYYLYCAKICGAAHYNMRIKITVVDSDVEYKKWLAAQAPYVKPAEEAKPVPASMEAPPSDSTAKKDTNTKQTALNY